VKTRPRPVLGTKNKLKTLYKFYDVSHVLRQGSYSTKTDVF
jgi:hypothetical protein